jgi:hypothetical protein
LVELLARVHESGGKIVRSPDGVFMVKEIGEGTVTPAILSALTVYRDELALLVPLPAETCSGSQEKARGGGWLLPPCLLPYHVKCVAWANVRAKAEAMA